MTRYALPTLLGSLAMVTAACAEMDSNESAPASSSVEGLAAAEEGSGEARGRRGHRRGPPQAAIDACADASAGDECSFENRRGDAMTGNCVEPRRGGEGLACRPEGRGGPGHGHHGRGGRGRMGPPQQAIDACASSSAGDECSFDNRRGDAMTGNCVDGPGDAGLACRPEGMRGPRHGRHGRRGGRGHGRMGPPQQAIDACASSSAGDECSFENRRGEAMTGNCVEPRRGGEGLACRPEGRGGPGHGRHGRGGRGRMGPPQQAIDACASSSAGDECSFDNRRGDAMTGNCVNGPGDAGLACRPEGMRGPRHGRHGRRGHGRMGPPQQAIDACADASAGDECSFESRRRGTMEGNCTERPDGSGLACRPEGFRGRGPHGPGPGR